VLTKLDVLTGLEKVPVCVAYEVDGVRRDEMPVNQSDFHHAVPVYEELPGWSDDISGARSLEDLPKAARAYVDAVEEMSGARISAIGVGPDREQTVAVHDLVQA
jgi:adenylosuccinate synthase